MIAALILATMLLPTYMHLDRTVKDTERLYTEAFAIAHAKFVMDTLMFQIPWRCIRAVPTSNPCHFADPKTDPKISVAPFLQRTVPRMFGAGCQPDPAKASFLGDGLITDPKGFKYRVRLKVIDLPDAQFRVSTPLSAADSNMTPTAKELVTKDADGKYNVLKKLILEVKWSVRKGVDPLVDPQALKIFLVAVKSDLER